MYCKHCGHEIPDNAAFCSNCGKSLNEVANTTSTAVGADAPSFAMGLLGFFIPILGIILYCALEKSEPLRAKSAGKGALISVIVSVVGCILYFVIVALAVHFSVSLY